MNGISTENHGLLIGNSVAYYIGEDKLKILGTNDLDSKEKTDALLKDPNVIVAAPDHAFDPSWMADIIFEKREEDIKYIAGKLMDNGCEKVVVWANSGIGSDTTIDAKENGVLRKIIETKRGNLKLAYATRLDEAVKDFYQRGIEDRYQNTGHEHKHIAPGNGFEIKLEQALEGIHLQKKELSLDQYRVLVKADPEKWIPCISMCVIVEKDLDKDLMFKHYSCLGNNLINPEYAMSGFARAVVKNYNKNVNGTDFGDREVAKKYLQETNEFYRKIL